jgi:hypothetical protein
MSIPFVPKRNGQSDVPIIGQPFIVLTYSILPVIRCTCAHGESLQLIVTQGNISLPAKCGGCGYSYVVQGFKSTEDGNLSFVIAVLPPSSESPS